MTSSGETLSLSVPSTELNLQAEQTRQGLLGTVQELGRNALHYIKTSKLTRGALALGLAVSAGTAVGVAAEIAEPHPRAAVADTGGYPDWDKPCVANNDGVTEGSGYWCPDYQWGYYTYNSQHQITGNIQNSSRGYGYRNCTDWVAWRTQNAGVGSVPGGWSHAKNWDNNAPADKVDNTPEPGDIAVWDTGTYGHVAFVESVNANGTVNVSEYNKHQDGNYGTRASVTADHYIDLNGTGKGLNNEVLSPGTSTTPPPDIRVPVPANFDGVLGQDLLGSSKRASPDITPNLNVFPSSGSWLGTNQLWSTPTGINQQEARLTAGDLDGDGKDDLLAIQNRDDGHPNIYWLKSQGSSFAAPELVGIPGLWFKDVKEWVSGDYNGDGHADLLAVSKRGEPTEDPAPNLVVFPSSGDWLGGSQLWGAPLSLKFADMKVMPADVDNDGKTDLLSVQPASSDTNANPQIWWSRSTGSGFENPQLVGVPNLKANETKWVAGNFDGQGGVDLVTSAKRQDGASNLLVFRATGSWLGGSELWGSPAINWQAAAMVPADLDGDGKTDLISIQKRGDGNPDIIWSRSTGTGFETPQIVGIPNLVADDVRWQQ